MRSARRASAPRRCREEGCQAGERRHAASQAFAVLDLAAHRLRGDRRDLGLPPGEIAELVDALDGDQGRVHVHREQLEVGEAASFDEGVIDTPGLAPRRNLILVWALRNR
jgi:hypothetical protein